MEQEKINALLVAYNRGLLTEDQASAFEEAINRGLIATEQEKGPALAPTKIGRLKERISGEKFREFDLPEIGNAPEYSNPFRKGALRGALGLLSSTKPEQELDILTSNFPEADIKKDKFGNTIISFPSGEYYVNRPGLSPRDITRPVFQGAGYLGAAKLGSAPFTSTLGRALGVGGATAAGSLGFDALSALGGSKQGVDLPQAGLIGGLSAGFEVLAPILGPVYRAITAEGKIPTVTEARTALVNAGIDPAQLTDDAVKYFMDIGRKAISPESAVALAEAETLPVKVPLTKGQVTGSAQQQMLEDMMEKGAYGEAAEKIMRGRSAQAEEALRANIPAIQERIGGGQVLQRGQGAAMAQEALAARQARLGQLVTEAYEAARGTEGALTPGTGQEIYSSVASSIEDFIPHAPKASSELKNLREIVKGKEIPGQLVGATGQPLRRGIEESATGIKDLYDWRRKVSNVANSMSDKTEATAMRGMIKRFDDEMQNALDNALISGDEQAIKAWKKAIKLRSVKGKLYESGDLVSALVEKEFKGGGPRLKVAPEAAGNYIFGASDMGFATKPQLARELRKMKSLLGAKSPEWNAIREEAFLRFASKSEGAFAGAERGFSGAKFKKAWQDAINKNPEVVKTIFTEEERKLISQFGNVAARVTSAVRGGRNYSNTASALANITQQLGKFIAFGERGRSVLSRIFPVGYEGLQAGQAFRTARGVLPKRQIPPGVLGGAGAVGVSEAANYSNQ